MTGESTARRQQTCAERIDEQKDGRLGDFAELLDAYDTEDDTERDEASERIYEYPLNVERITVWRVDLSTGGPGDWLEIHTDNENNPTRAEYHFNDWFDHASVTLDGQEFDLAVQFAAMVTGDFYTEQQS